MISQVCRVASSSRNTAAKTPVRRVSSQDALDRFPYTSHIVNCGNIMSFSLRGSGPSAPFPNCIPSSQLHLARYAVPLEEKLMMLNTTGKTKEKRSFSHIGKCRKLLMPQTKEAIFSSLCMRITNKCPRRLQNSPNEPVQSYIPLLQSCGKCKDLFELKRLHEAIRRRGLEHIRVLAHVLLNMYGKCGSVTSASAVFENISEKNVVSWNSMIGACINGRDTKEAVRLFRRMKLEGIKANKVTFLAVLGACNSVAALEEGMFIHSCVMDMGFDQNIAVATALVNMYGKCGRLDLARVVFDEVHIKDLIAWNGLITVYVEHGYGREALQIYRRLLLEGLNPSKVTFLVVVNACASPCCLLGGMMIHADIVESGFASDSIVGNTLINMYGKCGCLNEVNYTFKSLLEQNVVSWNSIILAYAQQGYCEKVLDCFQQMQLQDVKPNEVSYINALSACTSSAVLKVGKLIHASAADSRLDTNMVVGNALLCMYCKCGSLEEACQMFDKIQDRNIVSWNAIISLFDSHGLGQEALEHFWQMQKAGTAPNEFTFASALSACATTAALHGGKVIHAFACECGHESDGVVKSTLVNMYGRCGSPEDAQMVFKTMSERCVIAWSAMIAAYALHGDGHKAVGVLSEMREGGSVPDDISFLSIISGCSRAGLLDEACHYFALMYQHYEIMPLANHFSCLIDLFARTGMLDIAESIVHQMPFQPSGEDWCTLLGACKDVGKGELAAQHVLELSPQHSVAYVSLSNIYVSVGVWHTE